MQKKAAKLIVDKLDSNDYVSVTVYDNFVNVIQKATPDTNKAEIKEKLIRSTLVVPPIFGAERKEDIKKP